MPTIRTLLDWRIVAGLILCVTCSACNDTNDVDVGLRTGLFECSDGLYAKDRVALGCGSLVDVDTMQVVVLIGGATTSDKIKGLKFDVLYPRDRFAYVAGSTAMVPNNFLTYGGGVCVANKCTAPMQKVGAACSDSAACNVPGVNMPVVTASESLDPPVNPSMPQIVNGRLSIAIDRTMPADGVKATIGGFTQVLTFQLRAVSLTEPIDPTLLRFNMNARAVDMADATIGSVKFYNQLILWVQ